MSTTTTTTTTTTRDRGDRYGTMEWAQLELYASLLLSNFQLYLNVKVTYIVINNYRFSLHISIS